MVEKLFANPTVDTLMYQKLFGNDGAKTISGKQNVIQCLLFVIFWMNIGLIVINNRQIKSLNKQVMTYSMVIYIMPKH